MVVDIDCAVALRAWRLRHHLGPEVPPRKTRTVLDRAGRRVRARLRDTHRLHVSGCSRRAVSLGNTEEIVGHQAVKASNRDFDIHDRGLFVVQIRRQSRNSTWCRNASGHDATAIFQQLSNGKKNGAVLRTYFGKSNLGERIYLRPTILIVFQCSPRHTRTWPGLFPDGFPADGSVYRTLAA